MSPLEKLSGGRLEYFAFSHLPGDLIQFHEHTFQLGWNDQLEKNRETLFMAMQQQERPVVLGSSRQRVQKRQERADVNASNDSKRQDT